MILEDRKRQIELKNMFTEMRRIKREKSLRRSLSKKRKSIENKEYYRMQVLENNEIIEENRKQKIREKLVSEEERAKYASDQKEAES